MWNTLEMNMQGKVSSTLNCKCDTESVQNYYTGTQKQDTSLYKTVQPVRNQAANHEFHS